jgi:hypothetical protein
LTNSNYSRSIFHERALTNNKIHYNKENGNVNDNDNHSSSSSEKLPERHLTPVVRHDTTTSTTSTTPTSLSTSTSMSSTTAIINTIIDNKDHKNDNNNNNNNNPPISTSNNATAFTTPSFEVALEFQLNKNNHCFRKWIHPSKESSKKVTPDVWIVEYDHVGNIVSKLRLIEPVIKDYEENPVPTRTHLLQCKVVLSCVGYVNVNETC